MLQEGFVKKQLYPWTKIKIRDTVTGGSVLASGAQPPASVANFFPVRMAHTLFWSVKMVYSQPVLRCVTSDMQPGCETSL